MLNKLVVDIARYTKGVNPLPLHEASIQMVVLKVDEQFLQNARVLANSGMPVAVYHWIDPTVNADQQVAKTLNTLRASGLQIQAIFADFEQWWSNWEQWHQAILKELSWNLVSRFNASKLSSHAKQVFKGFAASEWKTFGYTRASFVNEFAPEASSWIPEYRWWLAHYITTEKQTLSWAGLKSRILPLVDFSPAMPPALTRDKVIGHQFTGDKLSLPGLYEDVFRVKHAKADVNFFDEDFLTEIGAVPNPKPLPEPLHEAIVTASPRLNVRSGPSTSAPILYKLMEGAPAKIAELKDGWARLRSYEDEWCSATYLQIDTSVAPEIPPSPETEPADEEVVRKAIVTARPRLNIRSGPGLSYPILYKLDTGALVKVVELSDDWARLQSHKDEWCSADYLRFDADAESEIPDPPDDPEITTPVEIDYPGVTYHKLCRYNANCHVLIMDMSNKRFHVTPYSGLKTVSYAARKLEAQIVVNGDGWGIAGYPNSIAASDGKVDQGNQYHTRPWINISKNNNVSFDSRWRKWKKKVYNTVSGDRYIINKDGKYNHNITAFNKDPRTAIGLTLDGKLILIVADGRTNESAGLSFRELGYIFEEFGTKTAINLDGGGSSALWIKDRIVNVPIDRGEPGRERWVANHLCVFTE